MFISTLKKSLIVVTRKQVLTDCSNIAVQCCSAVLQAALQLHINTEDKIEIKSESW